MIFKPLTLTKWHLTHRNTQTHRHTYTLTDANYVPSFDMVHLWWHNFFCTQALSLFLSLSLFFFAVLLLWCDAFEWVTSIHCCSFTSNVLCACEFLSLIFLLCCYELMPFLWSSISSDFFLYSLSLLAVVVKRLAQISLFAFTYIDVCVRPLLLVRVL